MAITITPTGRTGMDVGLSDIAVILSEQNQVLAQTAVDQRKLTNAFDRYLKVLEGQDFDDLQDERRDKEKADSKGVGKGFSMEGIMGKMPTAGGIMDYLKTFGKRLIPVALGLLFGDDLINAVTNQIEKMLGVEITDSVRSSIMAITGGTLLGFLFGGIKGGLLGLVLTAFTSDAARQKIADTLNEAFGTELESTDWQAWGLSIAGAFGVLYGPKLLMGAIKRFLISSAGKEAGEEVGKQLFKNVLKNPRVLSAMTFGLKGLVVAGIGYLALQGGKALIDYFRGKNKEFFDDAIAKSDPAIDEYKRTGDVEVLKAAEESIGRTQTEAQRMMEIGRGSGSYDEASAQYEKTTEALGIARGEVGRRQEKVATMQGVRGTVGEAINKAYDLAVAKYGEDVTADNFRTALQDMMLQASVDAGKATGKEKERLNTIRDAIRDNLDEMVDYQVQRRKESMSRPAMSREGIELMNRYGSRSTGNVIAPVDNSQMNQVTNNNSSPMVLPNGGATDYDQFTRRQMNATSR